MRRRELLAATGATLAATLAGYTESGLASTGEGAADEDAAENSLAALVPDDATLLLGVDAEAQDDPETERLLDALTDGTTPRRRLEDETGLDPEEADELLAFTTPADESASSREGSTPSDDATPEDDSAPEDDSTAAITLTPDGRAALAVGGLDTSAHASGVLVRGDWTDQQVRQATEESADGSVTETEYDGTTVVVLEEGPQTTWLAHLEEGFVVGDRAAVEAVIDVASGSREAVGGPLLSAYRGVRGDAHVRFAAVEVDAYATGRMLLRAARGIETVAGGYYTPEDHAGLALTMTATDEIRAWTLKRQLELGLDVAKKDAKESVAAELRRVSVERDGDVVRTTYEGDVADVETVIEELEGDAEHP